MKNKIKQLWKDIIYQVRYGQPFSKTAIFAIPFFLVLLIYFFWHLLPLASATSIQAGLTVVAEILGVLLGAILVIIGFLSDRLRQAETLLSEALPSYRKIIEAKRDGIVKAREKLVQGVLKTKSNWDANTKKYILALSTLSIALGADANHVSEQLDKLGFSSDEIFEATSIALANFFVELPSNQFFRLLRDAFDYSPIPSGIGIYAPELEGYWMTIYSDMLQDGIMTTLERYEFSRNFLQSWILSITIFINIMTLLASVFTLFGVTEVSFHYSSVKFWICVSLLGFLVSIFFMAISLRRMIVVGIEK